jgi:hypothetical protein
MEAGYKVHLANLAEIKKYSDDKDDAFWLANYVCVSGCGRQRAAPMAPADSNSIPSGHHIDELFSSQLFYPYLPKQGITFSKIMTSFYANIVEDNRNSSPSSYSPP